MSGTNTFSDESDFIEPRRALRVVAATSGVDPASLIAVNVSVPNTAGLD